MFPLTWLMTAGMEAAGVLIIGASALVSLTIAVREALQASNWSAAYDLFRASFGRGILLGLEFLVAADIIRTVAVTPSIQSVTILALIILIRTFLSVSLKAEIEGGWPWQRRQTRAFRSSEADDPASPGPAAEARPAPISMKRSSPESSKGSG